MKVSLLFHSALLAALLISACDKLAGYAPEGAKSAQAPAARVAPMGSGGTTTADGAAVASSGVAGRANVRMVPSPEVLKSAADQVSAAK